MTEPEKYSKYVVWLRGIIQATGMSSRGGGVVGKSAIPLIFLAVSVPGAIVSIVFGKVGIELCILIIVILLIGWIGFLKWLDVSSKFADKNYLAAFFDPKDIIDVFKERGKGLYLPPQSPITPNPKLPEPKSLFDKTPDRLPHQLVSRKKRT